MVSCIDAYGFLLASYIVTVSVKCIALEILAMTLKRGEGSLNVVESDTIR